MKLMQITVYFQVILAKVGESGQGLRVEGGNTFTYLSQELDPAKNYTFRVAAINGFGNGIFSQLETYTAGFGGTYVCCE